MQLLRSSFKFMVHTWRRPHEGFRFALAHLGSHRSAVKKKVARALQKKQYEKAALATSTVR